MKPLFFCTVRKGKLIFPERGLEMYHAHLKALEGKEVELTISKRKKIRSNQQNRAWWGIPVKIISDYTGHSPEDIHYFLRQKFLSNPEDELKIPRSTTSLSTIEFNELIENVQMWASSELGLIIPDPNQIDI